MWREACWVMLYMALCCRLSMAKLKLWTSKVSSLWGPLLSPVKETKRRGAELQGLCPPRINKMYRH